MKALFTTLILLAMLVLGASVYARTFNENTLLSLTITMGRNPDNSPYLFAAYTTGVDSTPVRTFPKRNVLNLLSSPQKTALLACYNSIAAAIQSDEAIP